MPQPDRSSAAQSQTTKQMTEGWNDLRRDELKRLAAAGERVAVIAQALGTTRNAVIGYARRNNIALLYKRPPAAPKPPRDPSRSRKRIPPEMIAQVRALWSDGATYSRIVAETGVAAGTIGHIVCALPKRRVVTWSTRARDEAFRITCLVASLTGESQASIAKRLKTSTASIGHWKKDSTLLAKAQALANTIKARWAAEQAAADAEKARLAAEERARIDAINAPILAKMSSRDRDALTLRIDGATLEEISQLHGITRERVRQIEVKWRMRGLIVPGANPLSEAAKRMVYRPTGHPRGRPRLNTAHSAGAGLATGIGHGFA